MDIKEVWIEFKDRITSPLFGSFVLSWIVCNWRIPIVLIFYKHIELISTKTTYIDVITRYSDPLHTFVLPAIFSIAYTFGYPVVKRSINVYLAKQTRATDEALLKVGDGATVSLDALLTTKAELKKKRGELADLLKEEGITKEDNKLLTEKNSELQGQMLLQREQQASAILELNKLNENKVSEIILSNNNVIASLTNSESIKLKSLKEATDLVAAEQQSMLEFQEKLLSGERERVGDLKIALKESEEKIELLRSEFESNRKDFVVLNNKYQITLRNLRELKGADVHVFEKSVFVLESILKNGDLLEESKYYQLIEDLLIEFKERFNDLRK